MASPRVPLVHIFYISISHPPSSSFFVVCLLFLPLIFLGQLNSHFVCATHKGARAGRLDGLEGGEGEAFSDFFMAH